ncbi:glycosyltransferase involved in cell wall biosynthesis [Dysgonomonas sp. PH5-45]|uniref:glycosyltransferase family 2 protein n=1 Tax=unclassified Dysgonomonas TaxID=2630389 RepID=UPI002476A42A|nr:MULTISPECIES: glycosyltransferase family 2 protein [unclassified Dysgonomonas]MDH6356116.1 glycosyltransferase involved in cell wall biosynthesis [Dysgonomonas sp. PH5-45]MDH6389011.1 glycosyltransferase involved in cell wall biosynthesis [Dysgonomonas sp. PH5-37]
MPKKVSIVLCSYNEATNLPTVIKAIHENMDPLGYLLEIIVVNDGSTDNTMSVVTDLCKTDASLFYIEFSRNFGHQNALKAGLDYSTGDCVISMDADMQHPPRMLPQLLEKWEEGYDIVYTRRKDDENLPKLKRKSSSWFYKMLNFLADIDLESGTADFRLMDRRAANVIVGVKGGDLFMRGLVKWIGFKQYGIDYMPDQRLSGTSKYTIKKMRNLALQGILSFSTKPLSIALYVGFSIAVLSLLSMPYAFISYFFGHTNSGWSSMICIIGFLGGFQLFVMGIIGLYIGRIFDKTRGFPPYIVRNTNLHQQNPSEK